MLPQDWKFLPWSIWATNWEPAWVDARNFFPSALPPWKNFPPNQKSATASPPTASKYASCTWKAVIRCTLHVRHTPHSTHNYAITISRIHSGGQRHTRKISSHLFHDSVHCLLGFFVLFVWRQTGCIGLKTVGLDLFTVEHKQFSMYFKVLYSYNYMKYPEMMTVMCKNRLTFICCWWPDELATLVWT